MEIHQEVQQKESREFGGRLDVVCLGEMIRQEEEPFLEGVRLPPLNPPHYKLNMCCDDCAPGITSPDPCPRSDYCILLK